MKAQIALYLLFAKQTIRQELVHRVSFITGIIGQWLFYGATFLTMYFTVQHFGTLGGWSPNEILFLSGFEVLSYALAACIFFTPCVNLPIRIRTGEFDAALTKPVSPFLHEIYNGFNFGYIGHTILSIVMICIAGINIGFKITFSSLLSFAFLLLCSILIQASILIFSSSLSFITINENPLMRTLIFVYKDFIKYPITIYHVAIQVILSFVMPMAFINFYPVSILLGAPSSSYFPSFVPYLSPFISVGLFLLSIKAWNKALSKYQSSGS